MLRFVNLNEIQGALVGASNLINSFSKSDVFFCDEAKNWISKIETILNSNKMPESSMLASFRGIIISSELGNIPGNLSLQSQIARNKIKNIVALDSINKTCDLVYKIIHKEVERFADAEKIICQVIAMAKIKNYFSQIPLNSINIDVLKYLWNKMSIDNELSPGIISIEGLVGIYDSLIIFHNVINNYIT